MNRREFIAATGSAALGVALDRAARDRAALERAAPPRTMSPRPADQTLRIAPLKLELAPGKEVRTLAYNGTVPGPLLRFPRGTPVTIDVINDTGTDELVHWHGLAIPGDVDGSMEEGTPAVPAHGRRSYTFTPDPPGTRWYHTHTFAGKNFARGSYTGLFGFLMIDPPGDPGRYDQELFLALHDWDGYITGGDDGFEMVGYRYASVNGRMFGAADPIRVREGERLLVHVLNASASEAHWVTLPGHRFMVHALDGNPVANPKSVEMLRLDPGERIDAIVEMSSPGVWMLGEPRESFRSKGMAIAVEYSGRSGPAKFVEPAEARWDYRVFGRDSAPPESAITRIPLTFRSVFRGHGDFEHWAINGKEYPHNGPVRLTFGERYRLVFDNQSTEDHPVHLHRHSFEISKFVGSPMSGVIKDVVTVPAAGTVEVDFTASARGNTLFHCHLQDHMDAGFMMVFVA